MTVTLLDGPVGTELERRGLELPAPAWSAAALATHPDLVREIHRDFAEAGAEVHATATFRTTPRALARTGWADAWEDLARRAVTLAREGAGGRGRVAGSIAPLEDCYSPALTPPDGDLAREHGLLAGVLADAGVDLLLVETMPTRRELVAAVAAAASTGLPVWAAVTLGPRGDFLDADEVVAAARDAARVGAEAFLVNCTSAHLVDPLVPLLVAAVGGDGVACGAYANTVFEDGGALDEAAYAEHARRWVDAGATLVGGCCGTTPAHVRALAEALGAGSPRG